MMGRARHPKADAHVAHPLVRNICNKSVPLRPLPISTSDAGRGELGEAGRGGGAFLNKTGQYNGYNSGICTRQAPAFGGGGV